MRLVAAPPAGLLVQRLGERRIYISGLLIVALSTAACAFAQTYWQLLLFRSLGGLGSAMFTVSSLGLMIRISPPDARGRVAGSVLVGVSDRVGLWPGAGQPDRGPGLARARSSSTASRCWSRRPWCSSVCGTRALAAPAASTEPAVSVRVVLRHRAYRAALLSNFATGWSAFGLRIALVPLFVVEVLGQRRRLRGSGAGDVRDRQRLGGDPQRLSVRPGRAAQAADRRADGGGGGDGAGRLHVVAAGVPGGGVRDGRGDRHLHLRRSRPRWPTSSATRRAAGRRSRRSR